MSEHILSWLPAYHDGELSPTRRKQVEAHLQDCVSCRAELQALADLSALLQSDPLPQRGSPERFAAQVQLLLPRSAPPRPKTERLPLWVLGVPLALMFVGIFLQAALWIASLVLAAGTAFPALAPWLTLVDTSDAPVVLPALNLVLLAVGMSLWGAWLAFWQAWKKHQALNPVFNTFGKEV